MRPAASCPFLMMSCLVTKAVSPALNGSAPPKSDLKFPKQKAASGFQRPLLFRWQSELEFQITAQA
jgi:hypothetical protein